MYLDLLVSHRVLDYYHSLIETWLLFEHDISRQGAFGELFLCLVEHRRVLLFLRDQLWVLKSRHRVKLLPTCDFARFSVPLHGNLLKPAASRATRVGGRRKRHGVIIAVTVRFLHIDDADVAHLTVVARISRYFIPTIWADQVLAILIGTKLDQR